MRSGWATSVSPPAISSGRCVVGAGSGSWCGGRTIHRDADVKRLHSALAEAIPPQSRSSIVHGDYRIDNTILDSQDATKVVAVLDWEMSTLGDPLSDAALMCVYRHPMFNIIHAASAWASPLMPEVDELANRYSLAADSRWTTGTSIWRWATSRWRSSPRASHSGRGWAAVSPRTPTWWIRRWRPLIAEGLRLHRRLEAGLQVPLGSSAQLDDARRPGRDRQQAAAHRSEQNPHADG